MRKASTGASSFHAYAQDANGSATGLENDGGQVPDDQRYDYDPYGALEPKTLDGADAESGLSAAAKDNPFRFEGFYYDSGVKTYDMFARHYRPDIGRFLSQDRFADAAGDQVLQADPLTQNRYAFAGGNPVNNVEFDGHRPDPGDPSPTNPNPGATARQINQHGTPETPAQLNARLGAAQREIAADQQARARVARARRVLIQAGHFPPPGPLSRQEAATFLKNYRKHHTLGAQASLGMGGRP